MNLPVLHDDVVGDPARRRVMDGADVGDEGLAIVEGRAFDVAAVWWIVDRHRPRYRVVIVTPEPLHAGVVRRDRDDNLHVRLTATVPGARDAGRQDDQEHGERAHGSTLSPGYPSHKPRVDGSETVE